MYESYRDLFLIVILCHNWYMSLVKRLIFTQCMYGMWIDNLSKTSQKKKLGNVCTMYYVDFFFLLLRDSETFVLFSYGQIQLWKTHICVLESFLPVAVLALRSLLWGLVLGLLWFPCGRLKTKLLLSLWNAFINTLQKVNLQASHWTWLWKTSENQTSSAISNTGRPFYWLEMTLVLISCHRKDKIWI